MLTFTFLSDIMTLEKRKGGIYMFLEKDAASGLSHFLIEYDRYVKKAEASNEKPLSILAYLVEMFQ